MKESLIISQLIFITFNNKNELYCFHDEKLQKEDFSKKNIRENNNIIISKEKAKENINNIYICLILTRKKCK